MLITMRMGSPKVTGQLILLSASQTEVIVKMRTRLRSLEIARVDSSHDSLVLLLLYRIATDFGGKFEYTLSHP